MLAPDPATTEPQIQTQISAATPVTQYCEATIVLIPAFAAALTDPGLTATVNTLITDAGQWSAICGAYTQQPANLFGGFAPQFDSAYAALNAAVETLQVNPSDAAALTNLTSGLTGLSIQMRQLSVPANQVLTQLATFQSTLQSDHTTIQSALATLAQTVPNGHAVINSVQANLGVNFFSSNQLSPCIAIVEINSQVTSNVTAAAGSSPEVIPVVLAQSLLESLLTINENALLAMTSLLQTWNALIGKYDTVINNLNQAAAPGLQPILEQLALQTAQAAWNQLAAFASQLPA